MSTAVAERQIPEKVSADERRAPHPGAAQWKEGWSFESRAGLIVADFLALAISYLVVATLRELLFAHPERRGAELASFQVRAAAGRPGRSNPVACSLYGHRGAHAVHRSTTRQGRTQRVLACPAADHVGNLDKNSRRNGVCRPLCPARRSIDLVGQSPISHPGNTVEPCPDPNLRASGPRSLNLDLEPTSTLVAKAPSRVGARCDENYRPIGHDEPTAPSLHSPIIVTAICTANNQYS